MRHAVSVLLLAILAITSVAGAKRHVLQDNGGTPPAAANSTAFNPNITYATPLAAAVASRGSLSSLIRLVQIANLTSELNSTSNAWTIFAPTDAAFQAALQTLNITAEDLVADTDMLRMVLTYHVVPVAAFSSNLTVGQELPTLMTGHNLTVLTTTPSVKIGADLSNATVLLPNIKAGKSVIHVVDTVLLPNPDKNVTKADKPAATLLELLTSTPELSVLAQAAAAANLTSTLNSTNVTWTVFAPRNEALLKAVSDLGLTPQELLANRTMLMDVLSYHVVPGVAAASTSLAAGQSLTTLLTGANLTVKAITPNVTIQGGSPTNLANVVTADLKAGQSIVHVVDAVLRPAADVKAAEGPAAAAAPSPATVTSPAPKASGAGAASMAAMTVAAAGLLTAALV